MKVQKKNKLSFVKSKKTLLKKSPKTLKVSKKSNTVEKKCAPTLNDECQLNNKPKQSTNSKKLRSEENLEDSKKHKQKKNERIKDKSSENKSEKSEKKKKLKKKKKAESEDEKELLTKKQLEGLKDIDPDFYKFLKENDKKLLDFDLEDSDFDDGNCTSQKNSSKQEKDQQSEDNEDEENEDEDEKFHKPSAADLEVPSDDDDFEGSDDNDDSPKITLNMLRQWEIQLQQDKVSIDIIRKAIQAFNSALASISTDETGNAPYLVVGAPVFNGVVQLCVLHLHSAILKYLGLKIKSKIPLHKTKKWPKLRSCLRHYLTDLIRLIEHVSSTNILSVLLKHLHQVATMMASFSTICKPMLKRLITLWATSDETVRVLAFLCILKITRNQQESMLHHVLKAMYLSYVRNSKFVSPNTLPSINFMRRSLVEMFALDLNVSYQHAFLYIRQLAIHLRNAVILKKKDSYQSVYNWQYINSIRMWTELLGATANKQQLQPLAYPLITIIIGAVKLIPTAQYFPLRFHCIQALIGLAKQTRTFIPLLPLILEVLKSNTFNKKHTVVSMKPMSFACILRLNKKQLSENGFRDEVVENVCGLMLEYLSYESSSLAFTELVVPVVINLKQYLKECKNANYSRKIKTLWDKIQENSKFIENERRKITFALKDTALVRSWEDGIKNKGTPLDIYYINWVKTHEKKKRRLAADSENINDYDLPMIKRKKIDGNNELAVSKDGGEVELFPSDSEEDGPAVETTDENKKEKKKKKKKVLPTSIETLESAEIEEEADPTNDYPDIVEELDLNDW